MKVKSQPASLQVLSFADSISEVMWIISWLQQNPQSAIISTDNKFMFYMHALENNVEILNMAAAIASPYHTFLIQGSNSHSQSSSREALEQLQQLQIQGNVICTRALRQNNMDCQIWPLLMQLAFTEVAMELKAPPIPTAFPPPPAAQPPSHLRRFSTTSIELLIRNPYVYYCRYILGLQPKESKQQFAKCYGIMIHEIMAEISRSWQMDDYLSFQSKYWQICQKHLSNLTINPHQETWVKSRLTNLLPHIYKFQQDFSTEVCKTEVEFYAERTLPLSDGTETIIATRSDRIDWLTNYMRIIDFKTGHSPSNKEVECGLFPQLPLEAWVNQAPDGDLFYVEIIGKLGKFNIKNVNHKAEDMHQSMVSLLQIFTADKGVYFATTTLDAKTIPYAHILRI